MHDNARSAEGGFNHNDLLHAGMFQVQPKDQRRVPHVNQVISCRRNQILIRNTSSFMLYLISISSSSYLCYPPPPSHTSRASCPVNLISCIQVNPRTVAEIPFHHLSYISKLSVRMSYVGEQPGDEVSECVILQTLCTLFVELCSKLTSGRGTANAVPFSKKCNEVPRRSRRRPSHQDHMRLLISPLWSRFLSKWKHLLRKCAGSTPATISIIAISSPHDLYSLWRCRHRLRIGRGRWLFTNILIPI